MCFGSGLPSLSAYRPFQPHPDPDLSLVFATPSPSTCSAQSPIWGLLHLNDSAQKAREDGIFTLKLDEGVSLATLVAFAEHMFPGVSTEDIGVWPADDGELVVSVRGGGTIQSN